MERRDSTSIDPSGARHRLGRVRPGSKTPQDPPLWPKSPILVQVLFVVFGRTTRVPLGTHIVVVPLLRGRRRPLGEKDGSRREGGETTRSGWNSVVFLPTLTPNFKREQWAEQTGPKPGMHSIHLEIHRKHG